MDHLFYNAPHFVLDAEPTQAGWMHAAKQVLAKLRPVMRRRLARGYSREPSSSSLFPAIVCHCLFDRHTFESSDEAFQFFGNEQDPPTPAVKRNLPPFDPRPKGVFGHT